MSTIPKIYIALRRIPDGIEAKLRNALSNPRYYKLGKELELEVVTTKDFLNEPPYEMFSNRNRQFLAVLDVQENPPAQISKLVDEEATFRGPKLAEPRIVLFKDVVPESLLVKPQFGPNRLEKILLIDEVFEDYRVLLEEGLAVRAANLNAAVNIAVAKIISAPIPAEAWAEEALV